MEPERIRSGSRRRVGGAGDQPALDDRAGLPVLIHHGRNDPVIPVEFGRRAHELLAGAGLDVRYLESDAGHWLPPEILPQAVELVAAATARASSGTT